VPGWTDHNASDPGITLLSGFGWLAVGLAFGVAASVAAGRFRARRDAPGDDR
jgi:hypothetical protein